MKLSRESNRVSTQEVLAARPHLRDSVESHRARWSGIKKDGSPRAYRLPKSLRLAIRKAKPQIKAENDERRRQEQLRQEQQNLHRYNYEPAWMRR